MRGVRTPERRESVCVMQDIDVLARSERTCLMPDKNVLAEARCLLPNMKTLVITNELLANPRSEDESKTEWVYELIWLWSKRFEVGDATDSELAWLSVMDRLISVSTECHVSEDCPIFAACDEDWGRIIKDHADELISTACKLASGQDPAIECGYPFAYRSVLAMAEQMLS